jgi:flavodoxin
MNTLVVYDTEFGNTQQIAQAIADAINGRLVHGREATGQSLDGIELLIVGAPTQAGRPTGAAQAFLNALPAGALKGIDVAAFDTRNDYATQGFGLKALMKVIGFAAPKIAKALVAKGGHEVAPPEGFIVLDKEGPLREGELERAAAWARGVAARTAKAA